MLRVVIFLLALLATCCLFADGWRFTIPGQLIDVQESASSPGNLPPVISTNGNLEIIEWSTSLTPTPEESEFVLKFRQPLRAGTALYYGAGEITCGLSNEWRNGMRTGNEAQFNLIPWNSPTDSVRIKSSPSRQADNGYKGTVPFLTILPVSARNVAGEAKITTSSALTGRIPDAKTEIKPRFRASPDGGTNAWILFQWKGPESIRGIGLFGGAGATPLQEVQIQYVQKSVDNEQWVNLEGRPTEAGLFRGNQFFIAPQQITTKALRLSQRRSTNDLAFSEIIVLQDMTKPSAAESTDQEKKKR